MLDLDWIKGNVRNLASEDSVISYQESNKRLIVLATFFGLILSLISIILMAQIHAINSKRIVLESQGKDEEIGGFALPQIFLLDENETLLQMKDLNQKSEIFQLPKTKRKYFMFQASFNSIGFIRDDLAVDLTKFVTSGEHFLLSDSKLPYKMRKKLRPVKVNKTRSYI